MLVFTRHALDKGKEFGADKKQLIDWFNKSKPHVKGERFHAFKLAKYGHDNVYHRITFNCYSLEYGPFNVLFTCRDEGQFTTIITVTQR